MDELNNTCRVHFFPYDVTVEVARGANLLQAAMSAGIHINASCGGAGVCGKCRVILEKGAIEGPQTEKLSDEEYAQGYRLACQSTVLSDVDIRITTESVMDAKSLNRARADQASTRTAVIIGVDYLKENGIFDPICEKLLVNVMHPTIENNASDLSRVLDALRLQHEVGNMSVDFQVIPNLPNVLREEDHKVTVTLAYAPHKTESKVSLINVEPGDRTTTNYAVAIDIGTTTVFGQLVNLNTGEAEVEYGDFNAQISYGEDVISRIVYAAKPGGLKKIQSVVMGTINGVIDQLLKAKNLAPHDISFMTLAGNTTMTQLVLGIEPKFIRLSPYVPAANFFPPVRAAKL
ncbi:MAG: 2Fe-2S iron-sulfur cluster binding domain-containing protein, partial [Deltaproteobacteria bacterium]|nr:2Fe-2S iron-sulfur cluster binding domain-containing protein [Deltaproteobacteria bacterium]